MRHAVRYPIAALLIATLPGPAAASSPVEAMSLADAIRYVAADPVEIDWKKLASLDLETGKAPADLQALDGKRVVIAAFIVPLEDDMQRADEFLLVPYFGACVHTPPPPPNQMVYVKMQGKQQVKIGWWDPVLFEGVLHLKQVESPYGATYFEMEGIESKPFTPKTK